MTRRTRHLRIVFAMLCAAWCANHSARVRADFEIESFTRYRIDRFDNNNNGSVDDDFQAQFDNFGLKSESTLPESKVVWPSSLPQSAANNTVNNYVDYSGSRHVAFDQPSYYLSSNIPNVGSVAQPSYQSMGFRDVRYGDFDDLIVLNTSFTEAIGTSYLQSCGMQLEKVIRFTAKVAEEEKREWTDKNFTEVYYGFRYYQLDDVWGLFATGGVLGQTTVVAETYNRIPGPHIGVNWSIAREKWQLTASGLIQAGQYLGDTSVESTIGADLVPGQYNRPVYVQPTTSSENVEDEFATVLSVARIQVSRALNEDVTLHLGCSGNYVGDVRYATESVTLQYPQPVVADTATQDLFITTVYTSLEFKR
jgi:hypothetical protein